MSQLKPAPEYISTKQLPKVTVTQHGLDSVVASLHAIEANLELVASEVTITKDRVASIESRMAAQEKRADQHSLRVQGESKTNLEQDAAIATIVTTVQTLASSVTELKASQAVQTAMLTEAKAAAMKLWAQPQVRALLLALWIAFTTWLSTRGITVTP